MLSKEYLFHHPIAFWTGCLLITCGVLSHIPMFVHAAPGMTAEYQISGIRVESRHVLFDGAIGWRVIAYHSLP